MKDSMGPVSTPKLLKAASDAIGELVDQYMAVTGALSLCELEEDIFTLEIRMRRYQRRDPVSAVIDSMEERP